MRAGRKDQDWATRVLTPLQADGTVPLSTPKPWMEKHGLEHCFNVTSLLLLLQVWLDANTDYKLGSVDVSSDRRVCPQGTFKTEEKHDRGNLQVAPER